MFDTMVLNNYQYCTDQDLINYLNVGYITKDVYDKVNNLKHPETKETPAENGGGTGTPAN